MWKIYKYLAICAVTALIVDLALIFSFVVYRPAIKKADAIIVLGAAISTPAATQRSLQGLKLYNQGDAPEIILSGGQDYPKSVSEAQYMANVITKAVNGSSTLSVASDATSPPSAAAKAMADMEGEKALPPMILEDQSHSTFENLANSKKLAPNVKSLIIVSDEFHIARAVLVAKREGFGPVYWSSPASSYYSPSELAFYYLREALAMVDYLPKFVLGK